MGAFNPWNFVERSVYKTWLLCGLVCIKIVLTFKKRNFSFTYCTLRARVASGRSVKSRECNRKQLHVGFSKL
jgi:regulatory protein YycH of two-component signal transduction system YycFG